MSTRRVKVWGSDYDIEVSQNSETVWIAVGDYLGERVEVKDKTEFSAMALWRKTARYRSN